MDIPWILISVGVLVVVLAIVGIFVFKKRGWKREVDYKSYYSMGIVWLPIGIVFWIVLDSIIGAWFFVMGLIYMAIGLKNKDKWGKPQRVNPNFQKMLVIAVAFGVVALVAGILVFEMML